MSKLFDVANKNVRPDPNQKKQTEIFQVIAKTREGYRINQGVDKTLVFSSNPRRETKKGIAFIKIKWCYLNKLKII